MIRSDDNLALSILRQIEEEGTRRRSGEVLFKCPVGIANFLMNQKREHIAQIETRYALSVRIEGDSQLVSPDFTFEKFKTATRVLPIASKPVVSVDTSIMDQIDESDGDDEVALKENDAETALPEDGDTKPKRRRRRRRRGRGKGSLVENSETEDVEVAQNLENDVVSPPESKKVKQDVSSAESKAKKQEDIKLLEVPKENIIKKTAARNRNSNKTVKDTHSNIETGENR